MCFPPGSAASASPLQSSIPQIVAQSSQRESVDGCARRQSYVARSRSVAVPTVPVSRPRPNCLRPRAHVPEESQRDGSPTGHRRSISRIGSERPTLPRGVVLFAVVKRSLQTSTNGMNFGEPDTGEVRKAHNSGPDGPGSPAEAREKPGRSGRGKIQRAPGLAIVQIVVWGRAHAHTANERFLSTPNG
jgi:hypothetical protein